VIVGGEVAALVVIHGAGVGEGMGVGVGGDCVGCGAGDGVCAALVEEAVSSADSPGKRSASASPINAARTPTRISQREGERRMFTNLIF
jgi:hypothetical protein